MSLTEDEFQDYIARAKAVTLGRDDKGWEVLSAELAEKNLCLRWRSKSGCSDGCCDLDQLVLEEHTDARNSYFAAMFNDNVIQPARTIVILAADELQEADGGDSPVER